MDREDDERLVARLRAALETYTPALHEGLRAALDFGRVVPDNQVGMGPR